MDNIKSIGAEIRNPNTRACHRSEVFWQITVPIIVAMLIILGLSYLAVFPASANQDSVWADISIIFLIIPVIFVIILTLIVLLGSIYLTIWLIRELPAFFYQAYKWILLINDKVQTTGNLITEPFLRVQSFIASIGELGKKIRRNS